MNIPEKHLRYVDLPNLSETFVDSFHFATFDNNTLRIELCITRMDEPKPPKPPTGRKITACRLVLTPNVTVELYNQLSKFIQIMEKQGQIIKAPQQKQPKN